MRDVDVHLVMAVVAISGARRRGTSFGCVRGGLNWMTLPKRQSFFVARASARSRTPASRMNPSASAWL